MGLTINQQQYLLKVADQIGVEAIKEVIPDFESIDIANLSVQQFQRVVRNVKNYLSIGKEYLPKLLPYKEQIKEKFNKSLEELTVKDLEHIIFKFPELNLPYVIKKFHHKPDDYPLKWTKDYEYGIQSSPYCENKELFYIKFYDLLTIDYDEKTLEDIENIINPFCNRLPSFLFQLYATYKGYHLILISHAIPYHESQVVQLMSSLQCDSWYTVFSSKNGFRSRLNPKIRTDSKEEFVAKYIKTIGYGQPHPKCLKLVNIYQKYLKKNPLLREIHWTGDFSDSFMKNIQHATIEPLSNRTSRELLTHAIDHGVDQELIMETGSNLIKSLKKPQQILEGHLDYYIALDQYTKTVYVCFKNLAMIDIDDHKLTSKIDNIQEYLNSKLDAKSTAIQIYRTLHGYHLFLVDRERDYHDIETILFMNGLGCDFYYSVYCYQRGYSVRLNRKNYQQDLDITKNLYHYLGFFGNKDLINVKLNRYVDIHYELMLKWQNCFINQML